MGGPHHVVVAPVVSILANLLFLLFTILWRLFLLHLILLLVISIEHALLVFLLLGLKIALFPLFAMALSLGSPA